MGPGSRHLPACPRCRHRDPLATGGHAFHCAGCGLRWRRALCDHCGELNDARDSLPSWRCSACHLHTRSYWKTPRPADAMAAAVAVSRRLAELRRRRRRRLLSTVMAALSLLAGLTGVAVMEARSQDTGTVGAICAGFERLMRDEASGTLGQGGLTPRLAELDRAAQSEAPELHPVTSPLLVAAARGSADPAFQAAATQLSSTCNARARARAP